MIDLLTTLLPLLLVDVLNPVLFALLVFALGSDKPTLNSFAILSGHTAAYFASGIVVAIGIEQIRDRLTHPLPIDFAISLLIGVACLWAAYAARGGNASEQKDPEKQLTPAYSFGYGAVVNFLGVPFALPYFAAVDQILKADLPIESSVLVLAVYNLLYALPFALIPLAFLFLGDGCKPFLEKINAALCSIADKLMPLLLLLIGVALLADSALYFSTGEPLW